MTEPSGPGHVIPFWPAWTRTLDAMILSLARARSRCRRCNTLLHVDVDALRDKLGGSAGPPATGTAYHVVIAELALLDGVVDPVGLPFRSRWHGMTTIGPVPTAAEA